MDKDLELGNEGYESIVNVDGERLYAKMNSKNTIELKYEDKTSEFELEDDLYVEPSLFDAIKQIFISADASVSYDGYEDYCSNNGKEPWEKSSGIAYAKAYEDYRKMESLGLEVYVPEIVDKLFKSSSIEDLRNSYEDLDESLNNSKNSFNSIYERCN